MNYRKFKKYFKKSPCYRNYVVATGTDGDYLVREFYKAAKQIPEIRAHYKYLAHKNGASTVFNLMPLAPENGSKLIETGVTVLNYFELDPEQFWEGSTEFDRGYLTK